MKKTIAILLVLVIGMAGVFADGETASLEINTLISDITYLGVTTTSDEPTWTTIGSLIGETDAISVDNTNKKDTPIAYLHVNSNNENFNVFLNNIEVLSSEAVSTTIDYTLYMTEEGASTAVSHTASNAITVGSEPVAISVTEATAITKTYASLAVELDANDWANALVADDYESTMTFEFKAI
ncbi:hypothetical protein [Sphaerochaeta sp. S2]|uniref:hypothetical protein n=1 Tax=Sphaerochaeta sp. S2 TaxID=2798868 RepID=UPI0018E96B1E|nr:hypothetical protein [Sphaerochaeta sp. S2]MBJ2356002.1 hypothetical protein [Sphaerochaeta sp. S2]